MKHCSDYYVSDLHDSATCSQCQALAVETYRRGKAVSTDRYVLDEAGNPVEEPDLMRWGLWMEKRGVRSVALTPFDGGGVSTVFLGLDHSFGEGPPVLWETMIFGGEHDGYQNRYTSRAEALIGHTKACVLALGKPLK